MLNFLEYDAINNPACTSQLRPVKYLQINSPTLPPLNASPVAIHRRRLNVKVTWPTPTMKRHPCPKPIQKPWLSRACQYSETMLVIMIPNTASIDPTDVNERA
jgi:hypothetical protein